MPLGDFQKQITEATARVCSDKHAYVYLQSNPKLCRRSLKLPQQQRRRVLFHKIRQQLQPEKIDIIHFEEKKPVPIDPTPTFPKFSTIRQDRNTAHRGGWFLTLVKKGLVYQGI